jgi:hypothetical protein
MVTLRYPCTACVIIDQAVHEVVGKLKTLFPDLEIAERVLESPKEARSVEGLEIERFPALLLNGEQLTAGSIPNRRELERTIRWTMENGG